MPGKPEKEVWFAMRVTYRREMKVKEVLDEAGVENYIPMRKVVRIRRGRRVKELAPVVHGLIFVYSKQSVVQAIKDRIPYFQYIIDRRAGTKIIVPDDQMKLFIAATNDNDRDLLWFSGDELNLTKGTRVRVIAGEFEGYEGIFQRVKGARDRRVVIAIEGVIAVALATINPEYIEVIEEQDSKPAAQTKRSRPSKSEDQTK